MSIYHCSIKVISRGKGQSAIASSAYRSGEKMTDRYTGIAHDFTRKKGVVYSEVLLPQFAPAEYQDREVLWNSAQDAERQSNAQLAREIEVALPIELSRKQQIDIVTQYVNLNFVIEGMCVDWSLHDKGDGNPHAHILLTTRPLKENGEWGSKERKAYALDENGEKIPVIDPETGKQKIGARGRKIWKRELVEKTGWNKKENAELWRANWAKTCNQYLSESLQIDHRSYERQGIEQLPTQHEGYAALQMEKRGKQSDRREKNREIRQKNDHLQNLDRQIAYFTKRKYAQDVKNERQPDFKLSSKQNPALLEKQLVISKKIAENEQKYIDLQRRETMLELNQKNILPWDDSVINKALLYYEHAESDIFKEYQSAPRFGKRSKKNLLDRNKNMDYYKIKYALDTNQWFLDNNIPLPTKAELVETLNYRREKISLARSLQKVKVENEHLQREYRQLERMKDESQDLNHQPVFKTLAENHLKIQEKQETKKTKEKSEVREDDL